MQTRRRRCVEGSTRLCTAAADTDAMAPALGEGRTRLVASAVCRERLRAALGARGPWRSPLSFDQRWRTFLAQCPRPQNGARLPSLGHISCHHWPVTPSDGTMRSGSQAEAALWWLGAAATLAASHFVLGSAVLTHGPVDLSLVTIAVLAARMLLALYTLIASSSARQRLRDARVRDRWDRSTNFAFADVVLARLGKGQATAGAGRYVASACLHCFEDFEETKMPIAATDSEGAKHGTWSPPAPNDGPKAGPWAPFPCKHAFCRACVEGAPSCPACQRFPDTSALLTAFARGLLAGAPLLSLVEPLLAFAIFVHAASGQPRPLGSGAWTTEVRYRVARLDDCLSIKVPAEAMKARLLDMELVARAMKQAELARVARSIQDSAARAVGLAAEIEKDMAPRARKAHEANEAANQDAPRVEAEAKELHARARNTASPGDRLVAELNARDAEAAAASARRAPQESRAAVGVIASAAESARGPSAEAERLADAARDTGDLSALLALEPRVLRALSEVEGLHQKASEALASAMRHGEEQRLDLVARAQVEAKEAARGAEAALERARRLMAMVHEMSRLDPAEADHAQRACDKARQPALDAKYKGDLAQKALRQPAARQLRDEARAACREAEAFAEEVGRAHDRLKAIQRAREDAARAAASASATGGAPRMGGSSSAPHNTGGATHNTGGAPRSTGGAPRNGGEAPKGGKAGGAPREEKKEDEDVNKGGAPRNTGGAPRNTGGAPRNTGGAPR